MKRKTAIITEGGGAAGLGHIMRCLSLCQAFEEKGIAPKLIVSGDEAAAGILNGKDLALFDWMEDRERLFGSINDKDVVIIDSYTAPLGLYKEISEMVKVPAYIDDNARLDYPKGTIINANIYGAELDYPDRCKKRLLGPRYALLRREFRIGGEREIKEGLKSIMVTFGGDDSRNVTPIILRLLKEKYPGLKKNVVIGRGFINKKDIEGLRDEKTNLIYNPDARTMKRVMAESDLAISAGGQTLYELARMGLPAVSISVAENQRRNIEAWAKRGFIEYAGEYSHGNIDEKISNGLSLLQGRDERIKRSRIGRRFVDGKGAERVVNEL